MAVPILLNEVSCAVWPDSEQPGNDCIRSVAGALRSLSQTNRNAYVLSDVPFGKLMLGSRSFASFFSHSKLRDDLRQVLAYANRSPIASFADLDAEGSECFIGSYSARGALFAHLLNTAILSFPTDAKWSDAALNIEMRQLDASGDNMEVAEDEICNMASEHHVEACRETILRFLYEEVDSAGKLWREREELLPGLRFLDRIEQDLLQLSGGIVFDQVKKRLFEMDFAISNWDPTRATFPPWESKISPESETRKRFCSFICGDGREYEYSLHARYTPGAGRIHFRLIPEQRLAEVAYIGIKLGA